MGDFFIWVVLPWRDCPIFLVRSLPKTLEPMTRSCKSRTVNSEPFPGSLSTRISPFISLIRCFVILMPRPAPSTALLISVLKRAYSSYNLLNCSAVMPCPVSFTRKTITILPASSLRDSAVTDIETSPEDVYLNALESRLFSICFIRSSSPNNVVGIFSSTWRLNLIGLLSYRTTFRFTVSLIRLGTSYSMGNNSSLPASILDRSSMSLIIPSRR